MVTSSTTALHVNLQLPSKPTKERRRSSSADSTTAWVSAPNLKQIPSDIKTIEDLSKNYDWSRITQGTAAEVGRRLENVKEVALCYVSIVQSRNANPPNDKESAQAELDKGIENYRNLDTITTAITQAVEDKIKDLNEQIRRCDLETREIHAKWHSIDKRKCEALLHLNVCKSAASVKTEDEEEKDFVMGKEIHPIQTLMTSLVVLKEKILTEKAYFQAENKAEATQAYYIEKSEFDILSKQKEILEEKKKNILVELAKRIKIEILNRHAPTSAKEATAQEEQAAIKAMWDSIELRHREIQDELAKRKSKFNIEEQQERDTKDSTTSYTTHLTAINELMEGIVQYKEIVKIDSQYISKITNEIRRNTLATKHEVTFLDLDKRANTELSKKSECLKQLDQQVKDNQEFIQLMQGKLKEIQTNGETIYKLLQTRTTSWKLSNETETSSFSYLTSYLPSWPFSSPSNGNKPKTLSSSSG